MFNRRFPYISLAFESDRRIDAEKTDCNQGRNTHRKEIIMLDLKAHFRIYCYLCTTYLMQKYKIVLN
ncbi:hypothetical protein HMPREF1218_0961 [Hoylesella pleuritidis F0068]|uniref:Uncharacterized protein n=1 Tax=Hoylesella pleuritidis F0068 TaxID=1081904 RepID=U2MH59_9BACT|nr:hypothetical protein HMPREF1218_0961 [Hoylesella pleuritidis F0068]